MVFSRVSASATSTPLSSPAAQGALASLTDNANSPTGFVVGDQRTNNNSSSLITVEGPAMTLPPEVEE